MNYIKSITYGFICALLLVACSEDDAPKIFTGDISATLISKGATEIVEGEQATITYDVILSRSFDKEISLKFSLANASVSDKLFTIKNPVKIAKNQTKGVLTITAPKKKDSENVLKEDQSFKINLDEITGIPNKVKLETNASIKMKFEKGVTPLSDAQKKLLEGYKAKGMDVSLWIGKIPVEVKVESPKGGSIKPFDNAFTRTYKSNTIITLSKNASADRPILRMTDNAFGMNEFLNFVFRKETIENKEFWNNKNVPASTAVLKDLGTDKVSKWEKNEIPFNVMFDSIELKTDKSIAFVYKNGTYSDPYDDKTFLKPDRDLSGMNFEYDFALWKEVFDKAKTDKKLRQHLIQGGSLNPANYLVYSTILTDDWSDGTWIAPKASYDVKTGQMTFKFNFDHDAANGYTKVTVTYKSPFAQ